MLKENYYRVYFYKHDLQLINYFKKSAKGSAERAIYHNNVDDSEPDNYKTGFTAEAAKFISSEPGVAYIGDLQPFAVLDKFNCKFSVPWKSPYPNQLSYALQKNSP